MIKSRIFIALFLLLTFCVGNLSIVNAENKEALPMNESASSFISDGLGNYFFITPDLELYGFGKNSNGSILKERVDGKYPQIDKPRLIAKDVIQVDIATSQYVYVTKDNTAVVWLSGSYSVGKFAYTIKDKDLDGNSYTIKDVKYVSSAAYKDVVVRKDGSVYTLNVVGGYNYEYKVNEFIERYPFKAGVIKARSTKYHMLALGNDSKLYGWGFNKGGQISPNNVELSPRKENNNIITTPKVVAENVIDFSSSTYRTTFINKKGELWEQGLDSILSGKLGEHFDTTSAPSAVPSFSDFFSGGFTGIIDTFKSISNYAESLGDWVSSYYHPDSSGKISPQQLLAPRKIMDNARKVSAGDRHTLVLNDKNEVFAYGMNNYGQIGNDTKDPSAPIKVMDNVVEIYARNNESYAVTKNGELWAWGEIYDEIGSERSVATLKPKKIADGVLVKVNYGSHSSQVQKDDKNKVRTPLAK